jgi:hypothetical protein
LWHGKEEEEGRGRRGDARQCGKRGLVKVTEEGARGWWRKSTGEGGREGVGGSSQIRRERRKTREGGKGDGKEGEKEGGKEGGRSNRA